MRNEVSANFSPVTSDEEGSQRLGGVNKKLSQIPVKQED